MLKGQFQESVVNKAQQIWRLKHVRRFVSQKFPEGFSEKTFRNNEKNAGLQGTEEKMFGEKV